MQLSGQAGQQGVGKVGGGTAVFEPPADERCERLRLGEPEAQARFGSEGAEECCYGCPGLLVGQLGREGGYFFRVLYRRGVRAAGAPFTGDRTGDTRWHELRDVEDVGLGADRPVGAPDADDPVIPGFGEFLERPADGAAPLGAGVRHVSAVLAPPVGAREEIGEESAGGEAEPPVLQQAVGKHGE
ncbi:hypothetical protein OG196_17080 [Kitasatospora purpeofusca]|uniref:hypothetical protein n=1 Tax=Kitasatospora purpeofusca TaxID=67352 RepID=UPI002E12C851|nr:hypothetical protein OG196_17080 [Kitasatospora purpeofusca]